MSEHHELPPSPTPLRGRGFRTADGRPGGMRGRVRPSNPGAVAEARRPPARLAGAAVAGRGDTGGEGAASPLEGAVLPFRRTAVKPRRKRRSLWLRLLRPAATAVLVVALPTALATWVLISPRFTLAEVEVAGNARVADAWVEGRLAPLLGRNLVSIPLAEVEASLQGHPWIASVAIHKRLPDGLTVQVEERRAAVLVPAPAEGSAGTAETAVAEVAGDSPTEAAGGEPVAPAPRWLADAAGRPIAEAPPRAAEEFVLVVPAVERGAAVGPLADTVPGAVEVARALSRSHPVWAAGLERIEALGQGEYRLVTRALPFPVLVRSGAVERPSALLEAALPGLARRLGEGMDDVAEADLRFADRLVLRPAAPTPAAMTQISASTTSTSPGAFTSSNAGPDARSPVDETRKKVG